MKKEKMLWKKIIFHTIVILIAGSIFAENGIFKVNGDFFIPSEKKYRTVYGNDMAFGAEIGIRMGDIFFLVAGLSVISQDGKTTFTEEDTSLNITPIHLGFKIHLTRKRIIPYLGAATVYFKYKEKSRLGKTEENAIGFSGTAGCMIKIWKNVFFDTHINYQSCRTNPSESTNLGEITAQIGGIHLGVGLGIIF